MTQVKKAESDERLAKKRLKIALIGMLEFAKKDDLNKVKKINRETFTPLLDSTFGKTNKRYEELKFYDLARDAIISSLNEWISQSEKQEFLEAAQKYIGLL